MKKSWKHQQNKRQSGHRKIYEDHYRTIIGEGMHVHHKNCDRNDNRPENLQVVSPELHYKIHRALFMSSENDSKEYFSNGMAMNLLGGGKNKHFGMTIPERLKKFFVKQGKKYGSLPNSQKQKDAASKSGSLPASQKCRDAARKMGLLPNSQKQIDVARFRASIKVECPHCSKVGNGPAMRRWHFDNCKEKNNNGNDRNR